MLIVLMMRLSLKLNEEPASAAKDDPTAPSVMLVGNPRPRLYFKGWIDIQRRVFEGIAFNQTVKQEIEYF
jgi:hypothetical protein